MNKSMITQIINPKMNKVLIACLLLHLFLATNIHEVIIIGAGASGIAASLVLTKHNLPHLMLEARDRIGGRIQSGTFENMTVDLGASFVHKPNKTNPIVDIMRELNLTGIPARYSEQFFFYENGGTVSEKQRAMASVFQELMDAHIALKARLSPHDISIKEATDAFFTNVMAKEKPVFQDLLYYLLQIYGNVEGADISELSARQMQNDETPSDFMPAIGYSKLIQLIFSHCKPELRLSEEVIEIDYSNLTVKVTTKKGVYFGKKVISSLPLGVIQARKVRFVPNIPLTHSLALFHLAPGQENKLFASFDQPFWDDDKVWLNFVIKGQKPNDFPVAYIMPTPKKHVLVFFLSGKTNTRLSSLSNYSLKKRLLRFLCDFTGQDIKINEIYMTRWHEDEYSLGSYTYYRVGAKRSAIDYLRKPIQNKIWFVGEHAHPSLKSLVQGAFLTGQSAAEDILDLQKTRLVMTRFQ